MSNKGEVVSAQVVTFLNIYQVLWLTGLAVSCVCFLSQIVFFILVKICRKTDEKILAQMTFTRIIVTISEYLVFYDVRNRADIVKDLIFMIYFYVDFVLVIWTFIFTKNLYDKIITVFPDKQLSLLVTSTLVWFCCLPSGLVPIFLLNQLYIHEFRMYMQVYTYIKFVVVFLNTLIYIRIFYVAKKRGERRNRSEMIKTASVAFLLLMTTTLQIFFTDILAYFNVNPIAVETFCVINSFHVVLITIIFIIILKAKLRESLARTITIRLSEIMN